MIDIIVKFHENLTKGETIKIITALDNYTTYLNRTDLIKANGEILEVYRANGAKIAINTQYIVSVCVIEQATR